MALTRGDKKVNLPISADFQRLGTQNEKPNIFKAGSEVLSHFMDLEKSKEDIKQLLLEADHKEKQFNYQSALQTDRKNKTVMNAIADAKDAAEAKRLKAWEAEQKRLQKEWAEKQNRIIMGNRENAVNSFTSKIDLDINLAIADFAMQFPAQPNEYMAAVNAWAEEYVGSKEFPEEIFDLDGVSIGNFKEIFYTKLQPAYLPHLKTSHSKAVENGHNISLNNYDDSWGTGVNNYIEQMHQLSEGLNIPDTPKSVLESQDLSGIKNYEEEILNKIDISGDFLSQFKLIMTPLTNQYVSYSKHLYNLAATNPHLMSAEDVENKLKNARIEIDKHVLASFAKYVISGDPNNADAEKATAMNLINDWWIGKFEGAENGIGAYLDAFTSGTYESGDKETIKNFAETQVEDKLKKGKIGYSKIVDTNNTSNELRLNMLNGDGVGSFTDYSGAFIYPDETELRSIHTKWHSDGSTTFNKKEYNDSKNSIKTNKFIVDTFSEFRLGNLEWDEVVNKLKGLTGMDTEQDMVDAYYYNINEGKVNGSEIINRMVNVVEGGADIQQDGLLNNFQLAFNKTKKFPSTFIDTVNALNSVNANDADDVNRFKAMISLVSYLGIGNGHGLDGTTVAAISHAHQRMESGNILSAVQEYNEFFQTNLNRPEEEDIIKGIVEWDNNTNWLDGKINSINDHVTDQKATIFSFEALKKIMLPKHWESFDYTIMDNEKFAEFGKANDSWFRTEHAIIRNALDNNRDTINEMIKNEMASLMISGKYNFKFGDQEGMEKLATAASINVYNRIDSGELSFENYMYDASRFNNKGAVLTDKGIQEHTGWNNASLKSNSIIQIMSMTNKMDYETASAFWEDDNYGEAISNLNDLWEQGGIRFKFDERSRFTNTPQWHIMVDVNGKGSWKELPNFDNFEFSWKPVNSKNLNTTLNQVSEKLIKDKVINQMNIDHLSKRYEWRTNDEGQKELWHHVGETSGRTNVGAYMDVKDGWVKIEDGQVSENYMAMLTFFNTLMANAGNNLDTFADVFSDWEDIDTWVEIAAANQKKQAVLLAEEKAAYENPAPLEAKTEFKSIAMHLDIPSQNRIGDNFFIYDHEYVDELKNTKSVKAIGPNLILDDNGIGKLQSMGYNEKEVQKILDGELGIPVHHYDQLLDEKYDQAVMFYDDLYNDVILSPLQRSVIVDMIATLGPESAGLDSEIYDLIHQGDYYGVFMELKRLEPFYANKARHSYHVNWWAANSAGDYKY